MSNGEIETKDGTTNLRLKPLVKKFSYNKLLDLCKEKGWRIPLLSELPEQKLEHDTFWLSDIPVIEEDIATHGYIHNHYSHSNMQLANKSFMQNVIVIVEEKSCLWISERDFGVYKTECNNSFQFMEGTPQDNTFTYCPYCGKKIKEKNEPSTKS